MPRTASRAWSSSIGRKIMQKIVEFAVDDLTLDAEAVADVLTQACRKREGTFAVRGLCQVEEAVYFVLHPCTTEEAPAQYGWVEVNDLTDAGITALLDQRWGGGFDLVGAVNAGDGLLFVLFAKTRDSTR